MHRLEPWPLAADEAADRKAADVLATVSRALGVPVEEHVKPSEGES